MPTMRGLTIIVTGNDPEKLYSALSVAVAHAACGGDARLFCEGLAVTALHTIEATHDRQRMENGLPTLTELRKESCTLGVRLVACQGGMALAGLEIDELGSGVEAGGLTSVIASLGDDRLVTL